MQDRREKEGSHLFRPLVSLLLHGKTREKRIGKMFSVLNKKTQEFYDLRGTFLELQLTMKGTNVSNCWHNNIQIISFASDMYLIELWSLIF
jgi:hypothetical protein